MSVEFVTENCERIAIVGQGESIDFDKQNNAHIVRKGGLREFNRKMINLGKQSRETTVLGVLHILEMANVIVCGIVKKDPPILEASYIKTDFMKATKSTDQCEKEDELAEEGASDVSSESKSHLEAFQSKVENCDKEKLTRIANAMQQLCVGLQRLSVHTYGEDTKTCAKLTALINSAQQIEERATAAAKF